jgi:hypothetical protein
MLQCMRSQKQINERMKLNSRDQREHRGLGKKPRSPLGAEALAKETVRRSHTAIAL